jgi:hypothetical protein
MTDLALKLADVAKVHLDFSIGSIKQVEEILSQLHNQFEETKDETGINGMALELAAYVITVIEKNLMVGKWERDSEEFGKDTFPYDLGDGNVIFPYNWNLKRIFDGEPDNVFTKFQTLVLDKLGK